MKRPNYEALDGTGMPYTRPARVIGELPTPQERMTAMQQATATISNLIGPESKKSIRFGNPVFCMFDNMTRNIAKQHEHANLLLMLGCDVPLEYCSYD